MLAKKRKIALLTAIFISGMMLTNTSAAEITEQSGALDMSAPPAVESITEADLDSDTLNDTDPLEDVTENTISAGESAGLNDTVDNRPSNTEKSEKSLMVILPTNLPFVLDPYEVSGRGQIYSDSFQIANYDDEEVLVRLNTIRYECTSDSSFHALAQWTQEDYLVDYKALYMVLSGSSLDYNFVLTDYAQESLCEFRLAASVYDANGNWVSFNEGSTATFQLYGNMSLNPKSGWKTGDITLHTVFSVESLSTGPPTDYNADLPPEFPETLEQEDIEQALPMPEATESPSKNPVEPETPVQENPKPSVPEPTAPVPENSELEPSEPEATPEPENPEPEASEPENTEPENPEQDAPEADSTVNISENSDTDTNATEPENPLADDYGTTETQQPSDAVEPDSPVSNPMETDSVSTEAPD